METRGRLAGRIMASEGHFYPPRYTEGEVWAGVRTTPPSVAQTGGVANPMNSLFTSEIRKSICSRALFSETSQSTMSVFAPEAPFAGERGVGGCLQECGGRVMWPQVKAERNEISDATPPTIGSGL